MWWWWCRRKRNRAWCRLLLFIYSLDRKAEGVKIEEDPVTDVRSLPVTIWVS